MAIIGSISCVRGVARHSRGRQVGGPESSAGINGTQYTCIKRGCVAKMLRVKSTIQPYITVSDDMNKPASKSSQLLRLQGDSLSLKLNITFIYVFKSKLISQRPIINLPHLIYPAQNGTVLGTLSAEQ